MIRFKPRHLSTLRNHEPAAAATAYCIIISHHILGGDSQAPHKQLKGKRKIETGPEEFRRKPEAQICGTPSPKKI